MLRLATTRRFERDLEREKRHRKDLDKLWSVVERLLQGQPSDRSHRVHRLSDKRADFRQCRLEPDRLLIRIENADELVLARTGAIPIRSDERE